jgi:hypothetical protein
MGARELLGPLEWRLWVTSRHSAPAPSASAFGRKAVLVGRKADIVLSMSAFGAKADVLADASEWPELARSSHRAITMVEGQTRVRRGRIRGSAPRASALPASLRVVGFGIFLQKRDDFPRDVDARSHFDPFQPGRRIRFHDQWPMIRS